MAACLAALIAVPDRRTGLTLARGLVRRRLAACVNLVPGVRSVYRWKGRIEEASELLLVAKTRSSRLKELTAFVRRNHPYSLPEIAALPVQGGSRDYLRWVKDSTS
ncbi:MAG TPA: divalent-cation tolerance protein CutA [Elusimicrobia bacterium]|nr:divalent-cation tolerance protein CutA [Elusimicrobiota bacterium]